MYIAVTDCSCHAAPITTTTTTTTITTTAAAAAAAGSMTVNDEQLHARDAAAVQGADDSPSLLKLKMNTERAAHFMLIEMAKSSD